MDPKKFHFKLPKKNLPTNIKLPEVWYPKVNEYWKNCTSTRLYNPIFGIKAIVIHATAGYSSEGAISVMKGGKASFHWLIPDEDENEHENVIWACVPETLAAWHVINSVSNPEINDGSNKVNHWSLGIELVNSQLNDPFSDWQIKMTADIIKYCWSKYPNLQHIVSHAKLDPKRRNDPGILFPWDKLKEYVLNDDYSQITVYENLIKKKPLLTSNQLITDICC